MNQNQCSFCKKPRKSSFIVEKPGLIICSECIAEFNNLLQDPNYGEKTQLHEDCSFCSFVKLMPPGALIGATPLRKGRRLVRNDLVCICDECLDVCAEIADEHNSG